MYNIKELRQRRADIQAQARVIMQAYQAERREPSEDEDAKLEALQTALNETQAQIAKTEERMDRERALSVAGSDAGISGGHERAEDDPKRGFKHFGEFAKAVIEAGKRGGRIDERLTIGAAAPSSYGREGGSGEEGGYAVPPGFSAEIASLSLGDESWVPLTDNDDVEGNGMTFPADEGTPWGSNGIRAYWLAEAALKTPTKPALTGASLRLNKMAVLVPMTDELLQDATVMATYVPRKMSEAITYKTNDGIMNGTGAGQPLGILNSGALVSVAKEAAQAADTVNATNVAKMFARNLNPANATWLMNQNVLPQLITMVIGNQPVYTAPNAGIQGAPYGLLLGRPIRFTHTAKGLGDLGDLMLADLGAYKTITKAGGVQFATSMHLWFDYDITAFRGVYRIDGKPWLTAPVTPPNSADTLSPFVALAERA